MLPSLELHFRILLQARIFWRKIPNKIWTDDCFGPNYMQDCLFSSDLFLCLKKRLPKWSRADVGQASDEAWNQESEDGIFWRKIPNQRYYRVGFSDVLKSLKVPMRKREPRSSESPKLEPSSDGAISTFQLFRQLVVQE